MKLSELIDLLTETYNNNGDMMVEGVADGTIYNDIELYCSDTINIGEDLLYIELYKND